MQEKNVSTTVSHVTVFFAGEVIHDVQEMQDIILEKDRRIGELEEALNETAKMTVAREAALDQHHHVTNHAQQKVSQTSGMLFQMVLAHKRKPVHTSLFFKKGKN